MTFSQVQCHLSANEVLYADSCPTVDLSRLVQGRNRMPRHSARLLIIGLAGECWRC